MLLDDLKSYALACRSNARRERLLGAFCSILTLGLFRNEKRRRDTERLLAEAEEQLRDFTSLSSRAEAVNAAASAVTLPNLRISTGHLHNAPAIGHATYGLDWDAVREHVLARDGNRCQEEDAYCDGPLDVHHLLFLSSGGTNDPDNLITLCRHHHSQKHPHMQGSMTDGSIRF